MSKLFQVVVAAVVIIAGITNSASAQTKIQKKKPKVIQVTTAPAIEYPADPEDPFYKMTVGLPAVDKVELFYLGWRQKDQTTDTQPDTVEKDEFPLEGNIRYQYQISDQNRLEGEAAEAFAAQWRKLLRGPGMGCFAPAYAIRFWAKGQIALETHICYHCHNLTIPKGGRSEIGGFNSEGKSGKDLLERLKELLPKSDTGRNHN